MTSIPGSIGERRSPLPVDRGATESPQPTTLLVMKRGAPLTRGELAAVERCSLARNEQKPVLVDGRIVRHNEPISNFAIMDFVDRQLNLPNYRAKKFARRKPTEFGREPGPLRRFGFESYRKSGKIKCLFGQVPSCRFTFENGYMEVIRGDGDFFSCFNKACKIFGAISREKSFRYFLRILTLVGANRDDIVKVMRIRDLWIRNHLVEYKRAICSLIFKFPKDIREFISSLPEKRRDHHIHPRG